MNKRLLCRTWTRLPLRGVHGERRGIEGRAGVVHYNFNDLWNDANWPTKQATRAPYKHGITIDFHLQGKSKNRAYCWRDKDVCFLRLCVGLVCAPFFLMTTLLEQCSAWVSSWGGGAKRWRWSGKWCEKEHAKCICRGRVSSISRGGRLLLSAIAFLIDRRDGQRLRSYFNCNSKSGENSGSCKLCCCCRSRHFTLGGDSLMTCENIYELNYGQCWLITN